MTFYSLLASTRFFIAGVYILPAAMMMTIFGLSRECIKQGEKRVFLITGVYHVREPNRNQSIFIFLIDLWPTQQQQPKDGKKIWRRRIEKRISQCCAGRFTSQVRSDRYRVSVWVVSAERWRSNPALDCCWAAELLLADVCNDLAHQRYCVSCLFYIWRYRPCLGTWEQMMLLGLHQQDLIIFIAPTGLFLVCERNLLPSLVIRARYYFRFIYAA